VDGGVLAGRFLAKKQFFKRGGQEETSAVDVLGQHYCRESGGPGREQSRACLSAHDQEWDLVKNVVISRDQFSPT
jgi:hypothetical protein